MTKQEFESTARKLMEMTESVVREVGEHPERASVNGWYLLGALHLFRRLDSTNASLPTYVIEPLLTTTTVECLEAVYVRLSEWVEETLNDWQD